jgi:hypothetical protein
LLLIEAVPNNCLIKLLLNSKSASKKEGESMLEQVIVDLVVIATVVAIIPSLGVAAHHRLVKRKLRLPMVWFGHGVVLVNSGTRVQWDT